MPMQIKTHTKEKGSIIRVEAEIPKEVLETKRAAAINHLKEHVELKGFRKGHVPEKTLVEHVGEMTILEESAELAIEENYTKILDELSLSPIGHPKIIITKIAIGAPLEFTAEIPVMPEVKLPDYKKISAKLKDKKEEVVVEEKEIENVITEVKKIQHHHAHKDHDHDHDHADHEHEETELTDDFVKNLGDFKDVADFKEKIKENILKEKTFKAEQKKRLEIIDAIRKETEIDIPEVLVDSEIKRMTNEFEHELSKVGSTLEKYLSEIKKTKEEVQSDWKPKATERVQTELILLEIKKEEKIEVPKEELEKEVATIKSHYGDIDEERIKLFVDEMLSKEKVFKFLSE
jgi:trigger factor